jgi:hemerythrin-like domain-containing protein
MSDAFTVLGTDHTEVKSMLEALESTPGHAAGASEAVLTARKQVAEQLVIASSAHEAAEEQFFWPAVRDRLPDGNELADHAISQESLAKEILARLDKLAVADAEFDELITEYTPAALAHIEFEENRVWPGMRRALSAEQSRDLGDKITTAKGKGPTRPHPRTPASPGVLKTAGPAIAAVDKLRDAVSGRGRSA